MTMPQWYMMLMWSNSLLCGSRCLPLVILSCKRMLPMDEASSSTSAYSLYLNIKHLRHDLCLPLYNMERDVAFHAAFDRFPYLLCLTFCAFEQFDRHSLPFFLLYEPMRDVLLSLIAKKWNFLQNKVTCNFIVTNRTGPCIFKFND